MLVTAVMATRRHIVIITIKILAYELNHPRAHPPRPSLTTRKRITHFYLYAPAALVTIVYQVLRPDRASFRTARVLSDRRGFRSRSLLPRKVGAHAFTMLQTCDLIKPPGQLCRRAKVISTVILTGFIRDWYKPRENPRDIRDTPCAGGQPLVSGEIFNIAIVIGGDGVNADPRG